MIKLNGSKKAAASPAEELENAYESPDMPEVVDGPQPTAEVEGASTTEPDEFDIAASVVKNSNLDESSTSDADADGDAVGNTVPEDQESAPVDPEEDLTKSADEIAMEEYRQASGASDEQAKAWLAAKHAESGQQRQAGDREQDPRQQQRPVAGAGAAFGALLGGLSNGLIAGGVRGVKRTVTDATNAALRGSKLRPAAGLTPEVIKNRLFNRWHEDYESGVDLMKKSMKDLVKTASAYNQLVKTSAPGRELEKIARSRGTDIKTLLGQIVDGSFEDADARAAAEALRTDPYVSKAWEKCERSVKGYGDGLEQVRHNMTQLVNNNSGKIDPTIEAARLEEIHSMREKVEKPFELPANPIADAKADGKSKQKSMWDQFVEMGQNGLNFLQGLLEKVATFVAAKLGR